MAKDPTIAWDTTTLGTLLYGAEGDNLSGLAKEDWESHMKAIVTAAKNWTDANPPDDGSGTGGTGTGGTGTNVTGPDKTGTGGGSGLTPEELAELEKQKQEETQNNAKAAAKTALMDRTGGGYLAQSEDANSELNKAYKTYTGAGGTKSLEDFAKEALKGEKNEDIHQNDFKVIGQTNKTGNNWNWNDLAAGKVDEGGVTIEGVSNKKIRFVAQGANSEAASVATAQSVSNDSVFMYRNKAYVYHDGKAYSVTKMSKETNMWGMAPEKKLEAFNYQNLMKYKTGGLADFTGPAWLDGTKSKPEIVLNQTDSANFIQLRDILADLLNGASGLSNADKKSKGGDNYYDIEISVESLGDDYDVEQLADKIRSMLYDDATYRNVNAINLIR
jgi:hypothetical protein